MATVSLADAKARLSELVTRAARGESVQITRRGKPVAQLTAIVTPKKPIKLADLQRVTKGTKYQKESAGAFMRRIRDQARY